MLITKFNRMIRNRFIWTVVAGIVCLSFVLSFSSVQSCSSDASAANMGLLLGKPVSLDEFRQATLFELNFQDRSTLPSEDRNRLDELTWQRLAMIRLANEMGLQAPDDEIKAWVAERFSENGVFDRNRYIQFLSSMRIPLPVFENYLRQDCSLQKISGLASALTWVGRDELDWRLRNITDEMTLDYATVTSESHSPDITISDEQAQDFYNRNEVLFQTEPSLNVRYVTFPLAAYDVQAAAFTAVSNFYNANISLFSSVTPDGVSTSKALSEVAADIEATILRSRQTAEAVDDATLFLVDLQPRFGGQGVSIEDIAASRNKPVTTSDFFTATEPPATLQVGPDFCKEAFALNTLNPHMAFSRIPIVGSNAVYVIAAGERREASVPSFESAKERAKALALQEAQAKSFDTWVASLHQRLVSGVASNEAFATTAAELGLTVTANYAYSITNQFEHAETLQRLIPTMNVGDILAPVAVSNGVLIIHVAARTTGAPSFIEGVRPELRARIAEQRARFVHDKLGTELLLTEGPEAARPKPAIAPSTPSSGG